MHHDLLTAAGIQPPSSDTGAYRQARSRLSESLLQRLIPETAECLAQTLSPEHLWCGRPVQVYDGTTVLMADSAANQASYPQHGNQAAGCGFPIARLVVFFCLVTGAVVSACIAPWDTSEVVWRSRCSRMRLWLGEHLKSLALQVKRQALARSSTD